MANSSVKRMAMSFITKVGIPDWDRDFSLHHCIRTGSGAHTTSYTMGTRSPFPTGKADSVKLTAHPYLVARL
jgi:hypothetical protein